MIWSITKNIGKNVSRNLIGVQSKLLQKEQFEKQQKQLVI